MFTITLKSFIFQPFNKTLSILLLKHVNPNPRNGLTRTCMLSNRQESLFKEKNIDGVMCVLLLYEFLETLGKKLETSVEVSADRVVLENPADSPMGVHMCDVRSTLRMLRSWWCSVGCVSQFVKCHWVRTRWGTLVTGKLSEGGTSHLPERQRRKHVVKQCPRHRAELHIRRRAAAAWRIGMRPHKERCFLVKSSWPWRTLNRGTFL